METHPDPDRWWDRKWRLAKVGGACSALSVLAGMAVGVIGGPEYADLIYPFSIAGMWGGLIPLAGYISEATIENVAKIKQGK